MYSHVLVAVAPGHVEAYAKSLDTARRLLADGGKITVLSVLEELPSYVGSYFSADQMKENLSVQTSAIKAEIFGDDIDVQVLSGHPTNTILEWASKHKTDCIVVSSHRPGLSHLLLGSTAARVVRHAECAVVVLR